MSSKVNIVNAKHFADSAKKLSAKVEYLDKTEITELDLNDAIPVKDRLGVHHVERVTTDFIEVYLNSNYKKNC